MTSSAMRYYFMAVTVSLLVPVQGARAQQILKELEPGMGYAHVMQWAIDNKLVFENFTKDSLVVRDTGLGTQESMRITVRFCGADDYRGYAWIVTIQQFLKPDIDAVPLQRDYVAFLSGLGSSKDQWLGAFSVRRERSGRTGGSEGIGDGLAISQDGESGYWEVGLFKKDDGPNHFALLRTIRRHDSICH